MERRRLGQTDLFIAPVGLGTGAIGGTDLTEDQAGTLLNRAVDLGMNLVDAAPRYGLAEERIGRHLSWRRGDFVLSTKPRIAPRERWERHASTDRVAIC